jgi:hypothetical protein
MHHIYTFIIKDKKYNGYKKIASFLFLINAIVLAAFGFQSISVSNKFLLFFVSFITIAYAFYNWYYKQKKERSFIIIYLLIAIAWIIGTAYWYFGLILVVLLLLQLRMEKDLTITISSNDLIIDGFLEKGHHWKEFNNVVLKDGLLTLDFINNKVFQVEPEWNKTQIIEAYPEFEKEFNEFCRQQLFIDHRPI